MSTMTGGADTRSTQSLDYQMMSAAIAALLAGGAMVLAHWKAAMVWPSLASVRLWDWTKWSYLNRDNPAAVDAEWLKLFEAGYASYLLALAAVGLAIFAFVFALIALRPIGRSLVWATVGFAIGAAVGVLVPFFVDLRPLWSVLIVPFGALLFGAVLALSVDANASDTRRRGAIIDTRLFRAKPSKKRSPKTAKGNSARSAEQSGGWSRRRRISAHLAGVALPPEAETRHIALIGQTGTGKSTALRDLLADVFARGDRAIVADPDGTSMSCFFEDGDVVINPFDRRGRPWDMLGELTDEAAYKRIAEALMPQTGGADGTKWVDGGRLVLTAVLRAWKANDFGSMSDLARLLGSKNTDRLAAMAEGTAAARFFAEGNERMLGSVLATLTAASETIDLLAQGTGAPVSIRRWVHEGEGRLWLPYRADQVPMLRSAFACLLSIAMVETLSLPIAEERRFWFAIDEVDQLGRITDLELLLTKGRKYGACAVLGLQSIAQLEQHYGAAIASVIAEQCGNCLILRCGLSEGGGTARFASDLIGDREVATPEETTSTSRGPNASTSVSRSIRRDIETAVLPSEIAQLPDREGYLKLATEAGWKRVGFGVTRYEPAAASFEARETAR